MVVKCKLLINVLLKIIDLQCCCHIFSFVLIKLLARAIPFTSGISSLALLCLLEPLGCPYALINHD